MIGNKKVGILVLAYNAENAIGRTLDRIPADIKEKVEEIFVFDDGSKDNTAGAAEAWKNKTGYQKLSIFRNPVNLGYGGNQKRGYDYATSKGYDVVVMLHSDGQYAPEVMSEILAPLVEDKADFVSGSRMLIKGGALKGGMPFYKFIGNKILTWVENFATGARISEWHSGYRAYTLKALNSIPFHENSNYYDFDSDIIIQFLVNKLRIVEVPIPTHYGDEISYLVGMKYAMNLCGIICQYKLHQWGFRRYAKFEKTVEKPVA